MRSHKIDLAVRKSWCESSDPNFTAKAADVVGLYVAPPEKAIVLCVDEKPSIQALERAQGYLKLPNGRALTDDVFSARMIFMTHGRANPQGVIPHDDLLAHFPYLGPPNP